MAFQQEAGYNLHASDMFMTFREVVFFMKRLEV